MSKLRVFECFACGRHYTSKEALRMKRKRVKTRHLFHYCPHCDAVNMDEGAVKRAKGQLDGAA